MHITLILALAFMAEVSATVFDIDKGVIVHLFEWSYSDIAQECEEFLGPYGFQAVQISPPSESIAINHRPRPWWEIYQPISYRLVTRSGDEKELQDMVDRCNKVGVRVFADVVLNHMTGPGQSVVGVGGSTASPVTYSYPSVPFTIKDFHQPPCKVKNYNNATEVRVCQLMKLLDLNQTAENVRTKQVEFLNKLVDMGIAGFNVDAAKYMDPDDLKVIYGRVKSLNTAKGFSCNTRPFIYQDVFDLGGEAVKYQEYAPLGMVSDFRYGRELGRRFLGQSDIVSLQNFDNGLDHLPDNMGVVFVDNYHSQRESDPTVLNYKRFRPYKMAIAFMLAFPHGTPVLMSGFSFDSFDQGPPHDSNHHTLSPRPIKDNLCSNGWMCEHRWRQVYNMVRFRNTVKGTAVKNWWVNGKNQIAFCRGNKGFIAFNRDSSSALDDMIQTCLPQGKYCDVISGSLVDNSCTGKTVEVAADGTGHITIRAFDMYDPNYEIDGVLALHVKDVVSDHQQNKEGHIESIHIVVEAQTVVPIKPLKA